MRHPPGPALCIPRRPRPAPGAEHAELAAPDVDHLLREREEAVAGRERATAEAEAVLAERTRDLDEMEALLRAREALIASARLRDANRTGTVTPREAEALHQLKAELDRQEASLLAQRQALHEREQFIEDSETRLFEKVQAQQEKETELEQREEMLQTRADESRGEPPAAYDEFRE
ncbi:MAG TPA: hypothetical protein VHE13_04105 [Opitutus sp.]|nr:hypothetical protein [Opitutus sp.]